MIETRYNPRSWHWIVAGDDTRAWSSAARAYVSEWPEDAVSRIANEDELCEVLERAGYPELAPLSANHVRRECQRRMIALAGARDAADLAVKLSNAQREAIRLLRKGSANWTADEAARASYLEAADAAIEALRAKSNAMEPNPPADYASDSRWQ